LVIDVQWVGILGSTIFTYFAKIYFIFAKMDSPFLKIPHAQNLREYEIGGLEFGSKTIGYAVDLFYHLSGSG
jgi:hypothetical protein